MSKQKIQLSDHFDYSRLLRFVLPCVGTMLFTSIYGIVDGLCVSNFVGKTAFAAVNLIMPVPMLVGSVGFMLGTGGSAIVGITLGEGDREKADRYFSLFVWTALLAGIVLAAVGVLIVRPAAALLGAEGEMLDYAVRYGRLLMASLPTFILQNLFQSFFVTAEKPHLGFAFTVAAGGTNMVLDVLLVGMLHGGVEGAAIATFISQAVGGVLPLFYFLSRRSTSSIHLGRTQWNGGVIRSACINGSSELMSNISASVVGILYNIRLMDLLGEPGVAAHSVMMYVDFVFVAAFLGFSMGSAPIVGYHYGAGNRTELRGLLRKSLCIITVMSVVLTAAALLLARPLSLIFVSKEPALLPVTIRAFSIYSLSFLMVGHNIYASSFFTALNDGFISALISFARTLVFQVAAVIVLPVLWGIDGVWAAVVAAETLALLLSAACLVGKRKKYGYA